VYKQKNLEMAWEKVKENRGSGGIDGQSLEAFEVQLNQQLERLHRELKEDTYQPLPVRQHPIPKRDKPGEYRMLGIPAIYDRVCQQADREMRLRGYQLTRYADDCAPRARKAERPSRV
jgi:RNA-directed DNA polymerase